MAVREGARRRRAELQQRSHALLHGEAVALSPHFEALIALEQGHTHSSLLKSHGQSNAPDAAASDGDKRRVGIGRNEATRRGDDAVDAAGRAVSNRDVVSVAPSGKRTAVWLGPEIADEFALAAAGGAGCVRCCRRWRGHPRSSSVGSAASKVQRRNCQTPSETEHQAQKVTLARQ